MPIINCKICSKLFYARPRHVSKGQGVYCSIRCKGIGTQKRTYLNCAICAKLVSKIPTQIKRSKSGKFFCSKSCQTVWRNKEFSGDKSKVWRGGFSRYRKILEENKSKKECRLCLTTDKRILAAHHIDENHKNNNPENLTWLCHNCHYLAHHDTLEKQKLLTKVVK